MAKIVFTPSIQQHVLRSEGQAEGRTVRDVLEAVFSTDTAGRDYLFDDHSALRRHIAVFVDGELVLDRRHLSDVVNEASVIHVFQAMSGG